MPAQPAKASRATTVAAVLMIAFMLHSPLVTGNAVTMVPPRLWGSQPMPMTSGRLGPKRLPDSSRSSIPQSPPLDEWAKGPTAERGGRQRVVEGTTGSGGVAPRERGHVKNNIHKYKCRVR